VLYESDLGRSGARSRQALLPVAVVLALASFGCSHSNHGVHLHLDEHYPEKLSDWNLFLGHKGNHLIPNQGVVPYDVNTPLFSDYATKVRTIWMPKGRSAVYKPGGSIDYPVGTIFTKTFSFGNMLVETRLLVRMTNGWAPLPYVWDPDQKDAELDVTPMAQPIVYKAPDGRVLKFDYTIPNVNQCKTCHQMGAAMRPLGATARNLNRSHSYAKGAENQLTYLEQVGYLRGAPAPNLAPKEAVWNDPSTGSVAARARAYMDVNCADCHTPGARAKDTGLFLAASITNPVALGVCKVPVKRQVAETGRYDVVPGDPDASVLVHRMKSLNYMLMMPSLGHDVVHQEGVALVEQWIRSMKGGCGNKGRTASASAAD
jgi:uncharacterized repeat protein (TIGR03806 family)